MHDHEDFDHLDVVNLKFDSMGRVAKFPVVNTSEGNVKLKKGKVIPKINSVKKLLRGFKISGVCGKENLDFVSLYVELKKWGEREKTVKILRSYNVQI